MDDATNSSQIGPDAADTARLIQATRRVFASTRSAVGEPAASITTARKIRVPVTIAVAAKCTPRMTTRGPPIPAPSQSMGLRPSALRPDLKRETAVGRMRIHREDAPGHMVGAGTTWTQRDRHLAAADTGLAGIDALAGSVGYGDVAEGGLQLLREPQRHLARR